MLIKSFQHVLNDNDTTGIVNEFLENSKSTPSMVSPVTDSRKFAEAKQYWVTLATPTANHGAKISFVSGNSRTDNGYIYS